MLVYVTETLSRLDGNCLGSQWLNLQMTIYILHVYIFGKTGLSRRGEYLEDLFCALKWSIMMKEWLASIRRFCMFPNKTGCTVIWIWLWIILSFPNVLLFIIITSLSVLNPDFATIARFFSYMARDTCRGELNVKNNHQDAKICQHQTAMSSQKPLSPIKQAWYRWKSLRWVPGRKKFLVGECAMHWSFYQIKPSYYTLIIPDISLTV